MRQNLGTEQWLTLQSGRLTSPAGEIFTRRTTKMRRRDAATLIEAGAPLVTYWYGGAELVWHDSYDALSRWAEIGSVVTTDKPKRRSRDAALTAGRWEDGDGHPLILVVGAC